MKIRIIIMLIISFSCSNFSYAQSLCQDSSVYKTFSVGDGQSSIRLQLYVEISRDSIKIVYDRENEFLSFSIISSECNWDTAFLKGTSTYQLKLKTEESEKFPTMEIHYQGKEGTIKLIYENDEPRVFTVQKLK